MKEKVILVGTNYQNQIDLDYSLAELRNLAENLDFEVTSTISQNLHSISPISYIGKGKLEELKLEIEERAATTVIFNDELSPSHVRNLTEYLDCEILDRSNLILEIFNQRATTKESKLQVEIAELQYLLPRLVNQSINYSRQRGGGVINRGSGETKLETSRRQIEIKIKSLQKELDEVVSERVTQRRLREKNNTKVVSLVGYTNSGKSTLLNSLMDMYESSNKQVLEKDILFATLTTSVRQIKLNNLRTFLLTDTVGFIDKLPHHLIKAFRSTLEEILYSDLLLHVVDRSHSYYQKQMDVVLETLKDIGVKDLPIITVYNKCDLTVIKYPKIENDSTYISAKTKNGIEELIKLIDNKLFNIITCKVFIPYDEMQIINYLYENAIITNREDQEKGINLIISMTKEDYQKFRAIFSDVSVRRE